jgi:hypothetical protein
VFEHLVRADDVERRVAERKAATVSGRKFKPSAARDFERVGRDVETDRVEPCFAQKES